MDYCIMVGNEWMGEEENERMKFTWALYNHSLAPFDFPYLL